MVINLKHNPTANFREDADTIPQKRDVYVTGFGKFGDVAENPTTLLVKNLAEHAKVTEAHVLEVSVKCCMETLANIYARAEERKRPCILLHFGVSPDACTFLLEQAAYNIADFRIPDERGYVATNEAIVEGEPDYFVTKVPLVEMLKTLQTVHPKIAISTNPGRFICNYVYFLSLVWTERQAAKYNSEYLTLFVHVPAFQNVTYQDQVALASKIVDSVAEL
ncbi:hypothetical protein PsorP6_004684 [Peronosclerospora sorghi]|uniref:Uncharacterized protein n=1 Tax=Peronosclerospora sorghi TaxID=230839 RepID=A0ACC0VR07_9STRA|nr:hypothetical protein PsorP6_004684 [Peronosclerospora sorghi]